MDKTTKPEELSSTRLRIGLFIWIASYLPFPLIILAIIHSQGGLSDPQSSATFLTIMYAIQFGIGFIGLAVAGKQAIGIIKSEKSNGVKKVIRKIFLVLRYGNSAL